MPLLIKCNEMKSSIWEAIDDQLLPTEIHDQAKECFFEFIRKNQSKVLLVLDGLDEMNSSELKATLTLSMVRNSQVDTLYSHLVMRWERN